MYIYINLIQCLDISLILLILVYLLQVNTQTTVLETKPPNNEPTALKWVWRPEIVGDTVVHGMGEVSATGLLDQKITNDASDYFWIDMSLIMLICRLDR